MAETGPRKKKPRAEPVAAPAPPLPAAVRDGDDSERALGRSVALGLPAVAVVAAIVVGLSAGTGAALLVLAAGTLVGAVALVWASLRTLSGDAPLSTQMEGVAAPRVGVDELAERKRRVLRALKDLEAEHAIGKIDDDDYEAVTARYRDEAKELMRQMDLEVAPLREEAEKMARAYLAEHVDGTAAPAQEPVAPAAADEPAPPADRLDCRACRKANDADAAFCKHCGAPMKAVASEKADATT